MCKVKFPNIPRVGRVEGLKTKPVKASANSEEILNIYQEEGEFKKGPSYDEFQKKITVKQSKSKTQKHDSDSDDDDQPKSKPPLLIDPALSEED